MANKYGARNKLRRLVATAPTANPARDNTKIKGGGNPTIGYRVIPLT